MRLPQPQYFRTLLVVLAVAAISAISAIVVMWQQNLSHTPNSGASATTSTGTNAEASAEASAEANTTTTHSAFHRTAQSLRIRDINGRSLRLADLYARRPVLLSVYRGVGCPMCVMNLKQLSQRAERIRSYGWDIAALSNDTPDDNRDALATAPSGKSSDSVLMQPGGAFALALYSDSNHVVMETLECYRRSLDTERHGLFLIDTQGIVRFAAIDRRPFERYDMLMDTLRALGGVWK
jgi:peroxiredoxin